jgi:hypothetical protein
MAIYRCIYQFSMVGLYKGTATVPDSLGSYCAAVKVFSFHVFCRLNLLSFWCEAIMDASVLLNLIHRDLWLAIVFAGPPPHFLCCVAQSHISMYIVLGHYHWAAYM